MNDSASDHGHTTGNIGPCADARARAFAEDVLRESEARFRSALKAGRMGSWETDYQTMTRSWTAEGMELFGITLPDGRGRVGGPDDEYAAALHPDDRHLAHHYHELADQQDSFAAEYRIVRPDGTQLWLSGRGLVVEREADGRALRLVSIMADATERKQAEERLRIEHERLDLALSAGRMGAYDMNIRDGVLWWSAQTYDLFGVSREDFVPTPGSVIALLHPDDRETFSRLRADAIAQRRPFRHEFRIVRPDGTEAWLAHSGQAEYDAEGLPIRSFGVTMDITERRRADELLRDADRKKDRFIAMLAHELRNPLAPIRNAVAVLRHPRSTGQTAAWCHDVIDRQVTQMARLLDDLLDASRLSRGQLHLRLQPLSLATAIEQAIEIAQPLIDAGGHAFRLVLPAQALPMEGDAVRLAQVFSNLLINAAKYTPPKGSITLAAERAGQEAVVRVTDNGIGIEARHLEHICEMFGQVESTLNRSQGGQGIGLALAKGLVELHGGTIGASSQGPAMGSEFFVRLPLASTEGTRPLSNFPPAADLPQATSCRILVADDLKDSADSLAHALQGLGHKVHVAYDGAQAIALAAAIRPEVALLDLGMPKLNGYDVCRQIRAFEWGRGVLVIAQTGWGQEQDRLRTREAGFDHHVVKPVDLDALIALVDRHQALHRRDG
ncbi:PAS domain-containing protein [Variovorax sp. J2P1-59]|uniref:hybrid sensor histidine kinase/response regulator n=1 Tax=Variovorax flavidus TaxID=3053501 RepID=UPI0025763709|nr:PAS domain-containing protein [Variovorax sp. J2P1-59]MDM0073642.1 PAS domain-containing protein [Variovorax sp. J2P1-59]